MRATAQQPRSDLRPARTAGRVRAGLWLGAVVVIAAAGCRDAVSTAPIVADTACGSLTADDALLQAPQDTLIGSAGTATGVSQGTRVYAFSFLVRDLCTTSPVADNIINFRVTLSDTLPAGASIDGLVYYSSNPAVPPREVTLSRAPTHYVQYFGQIAAVDPAPDTAGVAHADLVTSLQISFPTRGSTAADRAFLAPLLTSVDVTTYYHPYVGR